MASKAKSKWDVQISKGMILNKLPAYFLFIMMAVVIYFLFEVMRPFITAILLSTIVATVTYPLYSKILKLLGGREAWASLITCTVVVLAIVIPFSIFMVALVAQIIELVVVAVDWVKQFLQEFDFQSVLSWSEGNVIYDMMGNYADEVENIVTSNVQSLLKALTDSAAFISKFTAEQSLALFNAVFVVLFNLVIMFFILFFFYKDGKKIVDRLMNIAPMPFEHEKEILKKFAEVSRATIVGTILTASAQGIIAWIGFLIVGLENAFLWATAVSLFSLVPVVGTGMVWWPLGGVLLLAGDYFGGIFVWIWGLALIGTIDNVLRVIFVGSSVRLNVLLTFFAIFGGILAFGVIGIIFGPMLVVMFLTLLHIYELEYADFLHIHRRIEDVMTEKVQKEGGLTKRVADQFMKPKKKRKKKK